MSLLNICVSHNRWLKFETITNFGEVEIEMLIAHLTVHPMDIALDIGNDRMKPGQKIDSIFCIFPHDSGCGFFNRCGALYRHAIHWYASPLFHRGERMCQLMDLMRSESGYLVHFGKSILCFAILYNHRFSFPSATRSRLRVSLKSIFRQIQYERLN